MKGLIVLFICMSPALAQLRQNCDHLLAEIDQGEATPESFFLAASCLASNKKFEEAASYVLMAAENGFHDLRRFETDPHLTQLAKTLDWKKARGLIEANEVRLGSSNQALAALFETSQKDHPAGGDLTEEVRARDQKRAKQANALLTAKAPSTATDFYQAASLLVWSDLSDDIGRAMALAQRAAELEPGYREARYLACMAEDRLLRAEGKPQVWGTQYVREQGRWVLAPIDPKAKTDQERRAMGLNTLEELKRRVGRP